MTEAETKGYSIILGHLNAAYNEKILCLYFGSLLTEFQNSNLLNLIVQLLPFM